MKILAQIVAAIVGGGIGLYIGAYCGLKGRVTTARWADPFYDASMDYAGFVFVYFGAFIGVVLGAIAAVWIARGFLRRFY